MPGARAATARAGLQSIPISHAGVHDQHLQSPTLGGSVAAEAIGEQFVDARCDAMVGGAGTDERQASAGSGLLEVAAGRGDELQDHGPHRLGLRGTELVDQLVQVRMLRYRGHEPECSYEGGAVAVLEKLGRAAIEALGKFAGGAHGAVNDHTRATGGQQRTRKPPSATNPANA